MDIPDFAFIGNPCRRAGHRLRYRRSGLCVECNRERARSEAARARNRETKRRERSTPEGLEEHRQRMMRFRASERGLESSREANRRYYRTLKGKAAYKAGRRKWRASRARAVPPWADLAAIRDFVAGLPDGYHLDHVLPLHGKTVCGLHDLSNLQYLPASVNIKKRNKLLPEYESGEIICLLSHDD